MKKLAKQRAMDHAAKVKRAGYMTCEQVESILRTKILEQFESATNAFRAIDQDHDGAIDKREFRKLLRKYNLRLSAAEFDKLWRHLDSIQQGGSIALEEFAAHLGKPVAVRR